MPGREDITVEVELAALRQALAGLIEAAAPTHFENKGSVEYCPFCAALARAREVLG